MHSTVHYLKTEREQWLTKDEWDTIRRGAGQLIDIETAEVIFIYSRELEPHGDDEPEGAGWPYRGAYVRAPGSEEWVHWQDLPKETRDDLWCKYFNDIGRD